ncbi:2-hydroxyacid dehydrogenase [Terrimonas pollutisoli]|uniref:2-hydroxyacid dehydrogenase n=1 Tax=Terrimonas pollutisoli TaxID=3034147 RepID=UPI0023ED9645|nr:2-hydroxyacid dehydrogenase [Terrimonas sp. H1YJ31]
MKIAFFSTQPYDREYFVRYNKSHTILFFDAQLNEQTVNLANGCDAVCVFVNDRLDEQVIEALAKAGIKIIALRCAGFNNVDLAVAKENAVAVVRVPAYSPHAVAEHALALIMTLNRKTHKAYNRVREGNFALNRLTGFDLYGKTVGIIGTGKIGQCFAHIMMGLGCKVLAFDLIANKELEKDGVEYLPLLKLLQQSQVVSLHCPLTEQTKHLINKQTLHVMQRGAMLINTSRGGLIDTPAAIDALKSGQLGYLGIDVYEQEEKLFFHDLSENVIEDDTIMRLMSFPNVLITAHQGFLTDEALTQIALVTLKNLDDFGKSAPGENRVV